eukprot:CAMPEP_0168751816 /NCGR_PEP_ID=MMETSP0724-20121128/18043_1 /TAXON_ID=265536 /ORGANISM="Amphiprora sp., Strain CCMP467" /LENGTH=52 /DNA_ID=CAMNT_0008800001 /DNA_START=24 /DNA_END=179 /DNA_ORIENTATION=+
MGSTLGNSELHGHQSSPDAFSRPMREWRLARALSAKAQSGGALIGGLMMDGL